MDSNPPSSIENIILGVVANGLTALIAHVWRKGRAALTQDKNLRQSLGESTALVTVLQKATVSIAKTAKFDNARQGEKLRFFLVSPDVEAIVRQLYASQLAAQPHTHVESIRAEFLAALALRLGESEHSLADLAEHLFDALLKGCERALTGAIDHGILSAHKAKSAARHRLILDELAVIQKNLALLTASHQPDIQTLLAFEQKYRQQVGSRHAHIIPPHFDAARKVPIDGLYVPPDFVRVPQKRGEEPERLTMPGFLSMAYRAVLLGNPGGGKSTFTLKLCYDLAERLAPYSDHLSTLLELGLQAWMAHEQKEHGTLQEGILQVLATLGNVAIPQPYPGSELYVRHTPLPITGRPVSELVMEHREPR